MAQKYVFFHRKILSFHKANFQFLCCTSIMQASFCRGYCAYCLMLFCGSKDLLLIRLKTLEQLPTTSLHTATVYNPNMPDQPRGCQFVLGCPACSMAAITTRLLILTTLQPFVLGARIEVVKSWSAVVTEVSMCRSFLVTLSRGGCS